MINIYMEAGKRIHAARISHGYTRKYLAEQASISPKFLYEIENGKKGFSAQVLYNLCNALEVDCDYIMMGRERTNYTGSLEEA
ncbi:MAG: helix-turn-helix transcriptional regulator [Lachnospiraceae bacterium]|nr:helix-turn-helix transcriptional regulator [Lachnospiraceae bacterium]